MKNNPFFLQELYIENFMLHKATNLKFSCPITIIVGANGTGKTQVLDALLLLLGYPTTRIRRAKLVDLVGQHGEKAIIKGKFAWKPNYDLAHCLGVFLPPADLSGFRLELNITRNNTSFYLLETENRKFKPTRNQIRNLFAQVAVQGDNRLSFTEEGTVNVFVGESAKSKFELLLRTTGLLETRRALLEAEDLVQHCKHTAKPLEERLYVEQDRLSLYEENIVYINKREKLLLEIANIEALIEHKRFQHIKENLKKSKQQKQDKTDEIKQKQKRIVQIEEDITKISKQLEKYKNEKKERKEQLQILAQEIGRLKHIINEYQNKIKDKEEELLKINRYLKNLILFKEDKVKQNELKQLKKSLATLEYRLVNVHTKKKALNQPEKQINIEQCIRCPYRFQIDFFPSLHKALESKQLYPWWNKYSWDNRYVKSPTYIGLYLLREHVIKKEKFLLDSEEDILTEEIAKTKDKIERAKYKKEEELENEKQTLSHLINSIKLTLNEKKEKMVAVFTKQKEIAERVELVEKYIDSLKEELNKNQRDISDLQNSIKQDKLILKILDENLTAYNETYKIAEKNLSHLTPIQEELPLEEELKQRLAQKKGLLQGMKFSNLNLNKYKRQKDKVALIKQELKANNEHLSSLQEDLEKRLLSWNKSLQNTISNLNEHIQVLLSNVFSKVDIRLQNVFNLSKAGLELKFQRHSTKHLDLAHLSGGEKVLAIEALILSFHLLTNSPLHAIDEFTQKLDIEFKALALAMVLKTLQTIREKRAGDFFPQFILLCPELLGIELEKIPEVETYVLGGAYTFGEQDA